ncbi:MAG: hypothetical protein LBR11_12490 [Deltaproteobacteria bacterium]|jgi:hypothetical protein|nr:hypothetical protein [Deltaproteobacteria bacterium]
MLTSYIPGRLRLRLKEIPEDLPDLDVSAWPGVKRLTPNLQTGSFLLEYDPDQLSLETIAEVVERFDPEAAEDLWRIASGGQRYPTPPRPQRDQGTKDFISLSVSLIASLVTGLYGPKKWHAQCALFLAGLAVSHAWRYRHRIKPVSQWNLNDILNLPTPEPVYVDLPPESDEAGQPPQEGDEPEDPGALKSA